MPRWFEFPVGCVVKSLGQSSLGPPTYKLCHQKRFIFIYLFITTYLYTGTHPYVTMALKVGPVTNDDSHLINEPLFISLIQTTQGWNKMIR